MDGEIVYLAIVFSDPDPNIMLYRFELACRAAAELMDEGYIVFSPISHSYPIAKHLGKMTDHDFWMRQDVPFLDICSEMIVVDDPLGAWQHSKGVQEEINYCVQHDIPWSVRRF